MVANGSSNGASAKDKSNSTSPSLREQGNSFFKAGNYLRAAATYTHAIKEDPDNAALYSNRSAAFLHLSKITKALTDAEMAVKLKPEWDKGYFRKGCALESMQKYEEALTAFKEAAERNSSSGEVSTKIKLMTRILRDQKRALAGKDGAQNDSKDGTENKPTDPVNESEKRVTAFQTDILESAVRAWEESEGKLEPSVSFLENKTDEKGKEKLSRVIIKEAFISPETFGNCLSFLRQHAKDIQALAGFLVVGRKYIAFPQVWKGRGASTWPFGERDGCFVQLESPSLRRVWFIPSEDGAKVTASDPVELDIDTFAILQPLLR